jgi:signal transduction histidine kinase
MVVGVTALTMAAALAQRDSAEARRERETAERLRVEREHLLAHERERITREMHDGLGGQLVSVLSMVQRGNASANEVAEAIRRALDDMRIVIDSLEAKETGFTELLGKLRARLEPLLRRNGLRFEWRVEDIPALDSFEPEQSLHALRIIQEAVSNAIQHARASVVGISIAPSGTCNDMIEIEIRDDGVGLTFGDRPNGRGVHNMKVRADALGADLRIEAADPGRRVVLLIPHAQ